MKPTTVFFIGPDDGVSLTLEGVVKSLVGTTEATKGWQFESWRSLEPGDVMERLRTRIEATDLLIAVITDNNPNVFYEMGYAEALGSP